MSTLVRPAPVTTTSRSGRRVVVALAALEAWRLVRSPLVWLGVLLTVAFYWETGRNPVDWSGRATRARLRW